MTNNKQKEMEPPITLLLWIEGKRGEQEGEVQKKNTEREREIDFDLRLTPPASRPK